MKSNTSTMKYITLIIGLAITVNLSAQKAMNYDWDKPMEANIPDSLKDEPQITLKKTLIREFIIEESGFVEVDVFHNITWVNSDEAIEENNKVYIPMDSDENLILTRARTITPDGNIIVLKKDDILEATNEDDVTVHYYPIKGITKGSIIEYFYVQRRPASYKGTRILFQEDNHLFDATFELIAPEHLEFALKGYNGFGEIDIDTNDEDHFHMVKHFDFIPKYEHEEGAYAKINAMQFVYKLDKNKGNHTKDMVSYSDVAKMLIDGYTAGEKSEIKAVAKMVKSLELEKIADQEEQIRKIEVYLKSNIVIYEVYVAELENIQTIFKNKQANPRGIMYIMALACNQLNIPYEFVMTSNRKSMLFDKEFEAYNFLQEYLMYFPDLDKYLDPGQAFNVLGLIPTFYQDNYGVFFSKVGLGEIVSGVSKIKYIEGTPANASRSDMIADVTVADDFSMLNFEVENISTGYNATGTQPAYDLLEPDKQEELSDDLVKWVDENMDLESAVAENVGLANLGVKPLIVKGKFTIESFIVKAREKYIIKLGLFIGPQVEMYQDAEKKRTLPVDLSFRKDYHRVINFTIPEGYKVTNVEALNMTVEAKNDKGDVICDFVSTYTIEGNVLTVVANERYHEVHYTVEQFEDYRNVINAAADFNKIVIYLEKL